VQHGALQPGDAQAMACLSSPDDGYHRFKREPQGLAFDLHCVDCGVEKSLKSFNEMMQEYRRHAQGVRPFALPRCGVKQS
jgi:hypothetical protein